MSNNYKVQTPKKSCSNCANSENYKNKIWKDSLNCEHEGKVDKNGICDKWIEINSKPNRKKTSRSQKIPVYYKVIYTVPIYKMGDKIAAQIVTTSELEQGELLQLHEYNTKGCLELLKEVSKSLHYFSYVHPSFDRIVEVTKPSAKLFLRELGLTKWKHLGVINSSKLKSSSLNYNFIERRH